ncbi:hypothetical protein SAMN05216283_102308 [Sunxiuqinia elliptica]|uniref:Uncharacterized protein n=2 Tax=Sunxiuqinia elliptica TaxID=655355 RepID=A0A1I2F1U0_9BACT|nr:hypothetical protein SAMN05216283_102308 [Sunxiuqinia elliptica]
MIKTFKLDDEQFYNMLTQEELKQFEPIKLVAKEKYVLPLVEITGGGSANSWYNSHIGKTYEIYKYIIDTDKRYVNFLVKSRSDGTKSGYKPMFSDQKPIKGLDIVHWCSCRVTIGFLKRPQD